MSLWKMFKIMLGMTVVLVALAVLGLSLPNETCPPDRTNLEWDTCVVY